MARAKSRFWYSIFEHMSRKKAIYSALVLCFLIGVVIGVIVEITSSIGSLFLSDKSNSFFDFATNDVSTVDFFVDQLKNMLIAFFIIFATNLSIYSSFLNFIFLGYQGLLLSSSCGAIISSYGLLGIVNVVLIIVPINLALFVFYLAASELCFSRASDAKRYSINFKQSFAFQRHLVRNLLVCFVLALAVCIVVSLILPLILKSVLFVAF